MPVDQAKGNEKIGTWPQWRKYLFDIAIHGPQRIGGVPVLTNTVT